MVTQTQPERHWSSFNELLHMIDHPDDYQVPLKHKPVKPTQSVALAEEDNLYGGGGHYTFISVQFGLNPIVNY